MCNCVFADLIAITVQQILGCENAQTHKCVKVDLCWM